MPVVLVFNKADRSDPSELLMLYPDSVAISSYTGAGIDKLLSAVADQLRVVWDVVELAIPFDRGEVLAQVHREGQVLTESVTEDGMLIQARLDSSSRSRLAPFLVLERRDEI